MTAVADPDRRPPDAALDAWVLARRVVEKLFERLDANYDNSPDNPRNPRNPPQVVRWGEQTTDEMCLFDAQVTPGGS
jgi:hypothetical protein